MTSISTNGGKIAQRPKAAEIDRSPGNRSHFTPITTKIRIDAHIASVAKVLPIKVEKSTPENLFASNNPPELKTLNSMTLFPTMSIDIGKVNVVPKIVKS